MKAKVKFIQNKYTGSWVAITGKLGFDLKSSDLDGAKKEWDAKEAKMNIELNKKMLYV